MTAMRYTVWYPYKSSEALGALLDDVRLNPMPDAEAIHAQRPLPSLPGGVLLMMGGALLDHLKQAGMVKKNASLTSCREQPILFNTGAVDEEGNRDPEGNTHIFVTYDPVLPLREHERRVDILWDLILCSRFARTGSLAPEVGEYEYVDDFAVLMEDWPARLACDLETVGLDPWAEGARILSVTLTPAEGRSYVYRVPPDGKLPPKVKAHLMALLVAGKVDPETRVTGANFKFDAVWMAVHWGIEGINQTFDTHLAGSLLDENRSNSLETHAKIYTPMGGYDAEFNRRHDKSRMDLALEADPAGFLAYAGGDTDACFRVDKIQRRLLSRDPRLARFFQKLLLPASKVFAKVERRGILVDRARYAELEKECQREIDALKKQAWSHIPRRLILKYADNPSLGRPALLKEFLFTKRGLNLKPEMLTEKAEQARKAGQDVDPVANASTAGDHLQRFIHDERARPFIEVMEKLGSANKTLSTYIVGFQKHLRSDGRFHPTYRLGRGSSADDPEGGTVTGRLSATDPAYQTIVKRGAWAKPLRSVYPCPEGHGIVKFDFGQGELRIMAILANDPTMLDAYAHGKDLHALTAAAMMGLTPSQFVSLSEELREEKRRAAKAVNFGLLYGMMPPGLVEYARKSYGVQMTLKEAQSYWDAFFTTYGRLPVYHDTIKKQAHKHGKVRNPLGRIRHLPLINSPDRDARSLAERQAINSPIQSCLSDMMLMAMVEIDRRWPDLWMFGMTHDSLEMYLPLDNIEQQARDVRDVLQNLPLHEFDWEPPIQFVVDAEWALQGTLADVVKVKL